MKLIKIEEISDWKIAKKTKNIKAKPLVSLMVDKTVLSKFLIDTLEGKEPLGDGAVACIGEHNDIWQQMPANLLKKYDVVGIDADGWMICQPKLDNSVKCIQITDATVKYTDGDINVYTGYFIIGNFGEEFNLTPDVKILIQKCDIGDYICQSRENSKDNWVVRKKIFENTYNTISD